MPSAAFTRPGLEVRLDLIRIGDASFSPASAVEVSIRPRPPKRSSHFAGALVLGLGFLCGAGRFGGAIVEGDFGQMLVPGLLLICALALIVKAGRLKPTAEMVVTTASGNAHVIGLASMDDAEAAQAAVLEAMAGG